MSRAFTAAALLGAFASTALAHGITSGIVADGTYSEGWQLQNYYSIQNGQTYPDTPGWYAEDLDNGFVSPSDYSSADIICHKNAKPSGDTAATVKAGGTVDFMWSKWPESHIGPVITYVAPVTGDYSAVDKSTLKWVKIDEAGYDTSTSTWAAIDLISNNNTWTTTVPSSLKAGKYVFRHEIIALHGAGSENGAQNYPQCLNIDITGDGTESPEGTLGTALYKSTDPGILFNPYTTITSYEIPGPKLHGSGSGSGSGSGTGSGSNSTSSAAPASSSAPAATSSAAAVPTTTSTPVAAVSTTAAAAAAEGSASASASAAPSACKRKARRHARDVAL